MAYDAVTAAAAAAAIQLQYFQTAEDLGLYGRDPTATAGKGAYVATGRVTRSW